MFTVKWNSNCNAKVKAIKESQLNHVYWDLGRCSMMITEESFTRHISNETSVDANVSLQIWMLERLRAWRLLAAAPVEWALKISVSTPGPESWSEAHLASVWDETVVWGGLRKMEDWRSGANWLAWIIIWAKILRYSKGILLDHNIQLVRTQGRAEGRHKIWRCRDDPWPSL